MVRQRVVASAVAAALALMALPATASALTISSMSAQPADAEAGGHSDFTLSLSFGNASDQLKSLAVRLPPGLVGNPTAAVQCQQSQFAADGCPDGSRVGSTTADTSIGSASGDVYVLEPHPGELARFGIVARPPASSPIELESPISIRSSGDFGLDATITDIPRTVMVGGTVPVSIDVTGLKLTLDAAAARGPFVTLPTSCASATTTVEVTPYSGAGDSRSASFTPTGCASLPFHPAIAAAIDASGDQSRPAVSITVTQAAGEAAQRDASTTLPASLGADPASIGRACPSAAAATDGCPASATVGGATVTTPLLPAPLTGKIVLVSVPGNPLPRLQVSFGPPVGLRLVATPGAAGARLTSTIDGLPDLPLSSFVLSFAPGGLLRATSDLCAGSPGSIDASFAGQNGGHAVASAAAALTGCPPPAAPQAPPKPRAQLRPQAFATLHGRRHPWLAVRVRSRAGDPALLLVRIGLPHGWTLARRAFGRRVKHSRRTVTVRAVSGAHQLRLRIPASILHAARLRHRHLVLTVRYADGSTATLNVPISRR